MIRVSSFGGGTPIGVRAGNPLLGRVPGRGIHAVDATAVFSLRKGAETYVQRAIRYRAELV